MINRHSTENVQKLVPVFMCIFIFLYINAYISKQPIESNFIISDVVGDLFKS